MVNEWEEDYRNRCDALVRRLEALAETEHARAEKAESALREARKWPVELAKVTGLGEDATPEETANFLFADNVNQAIEWRDKLEAAETALRNWKEAMNDWKEAAESHQAEAIRLETELGQVRELLRRACEALGAYTVMDSRLEAEKYRAILFEAEAVLSPALDNNRCAVCGWPLSDSAEKGCTRGNCSLRPFPDKAYDPERADKEYEITRWAAPAQAEEK